MELNTLAFGDRGLEQRFSVTETNLTGLTHLSLKIGGSNTIGAGQTIDVWGAEMVMGTSAGAPIETSNTTTNVGTGMNTYLASNGLNQSYSYDAFGNMISSGNFNFQQAYTTANQLAGWSYDAAGDVMVDGLGNGMGYDAEGRVFAVTPWSGGSESYVYGADGERVAKTGAATAATDYIYFGGRELARLAGGQWTDLIYGASGLLAEVPGTQTGAPVYRMLDHLGTQVGTLDTNGVLLSLTDYAPFGQVFAGGSTDPYKFTGKERDTESGNDYFGARYYASNMGRMMSPDWSAKVMPVPYAKLGDPQTLNLYSYVGNNPLSRTDPTGHYVINCGGGVKNCDQQQKNFNDAVAAGLKSKDQSVVQAAKAYGALGEKNGVNVSIVNVVDPKNANVAGATGAQAGTGGLQSTDGGKTFMQATQVNIQAGLSGNQLSDVAVHEGQHVGDRENFVNALQADPTGQNVQGLNITHHMSEINAYGVENANRGQRGESPRDVNDILSHPPYNTPDSNSPLFPIFPTPY